MQFCVYICITYYTFIFPTDNINALHVRQLVNHYTLSVGISILYILCSIMTKINYILIDYDLYL